MSKNGDGLWQRIIPALVSILFFSSLISVSSAVTLSIQNVTLAGTGSNDSSSLVLDSVPNGLAGFKIDTSMTPTGIARPISVSFPSVYTMKNSTTLPADQARVVGVDLSGGIEAGATNVTLCTFTMQGVAAGTTSMMASIGELTDDSGSPINATIVNSTIIVGSATQTPTVSPTATATATLTTSPTSSPTVIPTVTSTQTPVPGTVDFTASPRSGAAPLTVGFTPLVNGTVSGYIWSFGDGTSSDLQSPSHVYTTGTYSLSLTVTFSEGGTASITKPGYITVNGSGPTPTKTATPTPTPTPIPLIANFSASPVTGVPPLSVQFVDRSEGIPTKWRWNFGDGVYSTVMNPLHVYGGIGRYTVTLEVENSDNSAIFRKASFIETKSK
jgi:PKD repeat protein